MCPVAPFVRQIRRIPLSPIRSVRGRRRAGRCRTRAARRRTSRCRARARAGRRRRCRRRRWDGGWSERRLPARRASRAGTAPAGEDREDDRDLRPALLATRQPGEVGGLHLGGVERERSPPAGPAVRDGASRRVDEEEAAVLPQRRDHRPERLGIGERIGADAGAQEAGSDGPGGERGESAASGRDELQDTLLPLGHELCALVRRRAGRARASAGATARRGRCPHGRATRCGSRASCSAGSNGNDPSASSSVVPVIRGGTARRRSAATNAGGSRCW